MHIAEQPKMHIPAFVNWIMEHDDNDCGREYDSGCLACTLAHLAEQYWDPLPGQKGPDFILDIDDQYKQVMQLLIATKGKQSKISVDEVPMVWHTMSERIQCDSHEFLSWTISDALPWFFENPTPGFGDEAGMLTKEYDNLMFPLDLANYVDRLKDLKAMFQLTTQTRFVCQNPKCDDFTIIGPEDQFGIQLPVSSSDKVKLTELIDQRWNERADQVDDFKCDGCSESHPRPGQTQLIGAPEVIFIALVATRDTHDLRKGQIIRKLVPMNVEYGLWLDLSKYQPEEHNDGPRESVSSP
jgi:hypothetical protein